MSKSVVMAASQDGNLTCTICLDAYKDPRVLPCCHTFCKACLEHVLEKSETKRKLTCPQCRSEHSIPANGIDGLLTDFTIASDVAASTALKSSEQKPPCGECDGGDPAVAYCCECSTYLCDFCSGGHKRMKRFREHRVLPLDSLTPDVVKSSSQGQPTCPKHLDKPLVVYCRVCEQLVCNDCIVSADHEGHKYSAIDSATREEVETRLKEQLDRAKTKLTGLRGNFDYISEVEQQARTQAADLKAAINKDFDALISALENRRAKLLKEAEAKCGGDVETVSSQKEVVERAVAGLETTVGFTDRVLQRSSDAEFLSLSPQASSRLKHLMGTKWESAQVKAIEQTERTLVTSQSKIEELQKFGRINEKGGLIVHGVTKTYMLGSRQEFTVASERGFELVKLVAQGYHGQTQKRFVLNPSRKCKGKWVIPFTPTCGGHQSVTLSVDGKEVDGSPFSFTVQGTPAKGDQVSLGPDWPTDSPPPQGEKGIVTFSMHTMPGYLAIRWLREGKEQVLEQVKWGAQGRYEVQLALARPV